MSEAVALDDEVAERLVQFEFDPLGYVMWAFPWGEAGTDLEHETGPVKWQRDLLVSVGQELKAGGDLGAIVLRAVRSGHGIGKSALTAWVIKWGLETFAHTRGVATAMTDTQLKTKTWAELSKWHAMSITREHFTCHAKSIHANGDDETTRTWRIDCVPWSENNTSAFAGMHNKRRRIIMVFDEGSEIADKIYEVAEGALTDGLTQIIWCVFGNPTLTSGKFYDLFANPRWVSVTVDAREVPFTNRTLHEVWKTEYGEDSDFYRVRVRGLPPRTGVTNFISPDVVRAAMRRELAPSLYTYLPKYLGIDPAHFGDDESVVTLRQGGMVLGQWWYSGLDGPNLAGKVVELWRQHPQVTQGLVDAIGVGASCADVLARVPGFPLVRVNVATPATNDFEYFNLRAELWGRMRAWLEQAAIPNDETLFKQLTTLQYGFDAKARIQLESKKDLKKRGVQSPDRADSLSMTFLAEAVRKVESVRRHDALPVKKRTVVWKR